jgi:hypothetical protein
LRRKFAAISGRFIIRSGSTFFIADDPYYLDDRDENENCQGPRNSARPKFSKERERQKA